MNLLFQRCRRSHRVRFNDAHVLTVLERRRSIIRTLHCQTVTVTIFESQLLYSYYSNAGVEKTKVKTVYCSIKTEKFLDPVTLENYVS